MSLGPVSLQKGSSPGIPQHLRGQPRIVIDTLCVDADIDMDSAATHVIDGVSWTVTTDTATSAVAGSGGIRVVTSNSTLWVMTTEIPHYTADDLLCVTVEFSLTTMGTNGQSIQVRLGQAADGTSSTTEDVTFTFRKTSSSAWRFRPGYYGSSSYSMSYVGDNPFSSSLPSRIVMQIIGHGNTWKAKFGTAAGRPRHNGLVAENNATARICSRSAGTVAGATPALCKYLRIVFGSNSGDLDVTVTGVEVTVSGNT